jgi:serine/threonine protein kinase
VFDFGDHVDTPYLVMEHVVGPRLAQVLSQHGRLPIGIALKLVRQVAAVLEEAHAHGIVHADVKCDNIIVETKQDGSLQPRIIDWGIARLPDRLDPFDCTFVTGTPEYLAPEVVMGWRPSFPADVYALGVMVYELISGSTPFAGSRDVMVTKVEGRPLPLAVRCSELDVPAGLDALVLRALARDPAARFPDARAFGRALDAIPTTASGAVSLRADAASPVFSTEAPTASMSIDPEKHAFRDGGADKLIVAYLELSRALVDQHCLGQAIHELEAAVELLSHAGASAPVWRLLLTLAALYEGEGNRTRAREAARLARDAATNVGSSVGRERAERLASRLD